MSTAVATAEPSHPHADEITTYATAVAIGQVASDRCPDILACFPCLDELRAKMHLTQEDGPIVIAQTFGRVEQFTKDFQASPSPQAWCDKTLSCFGPGGTLMSGLLKRQ